MNLPLSRFVGSDPHGLTQIAFGANEVPQNMPAGFGADARQIHAHAATATDRRSDPYRRGRRKAIYLTWIDHDGCLGERNNTTRERRFNNISIKGCDRQNEGFRGRYGLY